MIDALAFLESIERKPLFMAVHYGSFDESGKYQEHPVVSFAGVCSDQKRLRRFEDDWGALLRSYGLRTLHMARASRLLEGCGHRMPQGQSIEARIDALLPFADCINQHLELGLIQTWDVKGYASLKMDVKKSLGSSNDPYYLAFVRGLLEVKDYIAEEDRISIVVDDDLVTAWDCYLHYRAIQQVNAYPELKNTVVGLSFANDEHFPALQAADLVAFLSRRVAAEKFYGIPNEFNRLYEYITEISRPKGSIINWKYRFLSELELVDLGIAIEKQHEQRRIQKIQPNNATVNEGSAQRDKGQAGSGEGSESKKAEV